MLFHLKSDVLIVRVRQNGVSDVSFHIGCLTFQSCNSDGEKSEKLLGSCYLIWNQTSWWSVFTKSESPMSDFTSNAWNSRLGLSEIGQSFGFMLSHLKSNVLDVWVRQIGVSNVWFHIGCLTFQSRDSVGEKSEKLLGSCYLIWNQTS